MSNTLVTFALTSTPCSVCSIDGRISLRDLKSLTALDSVDHQHNASPRLVCLEQSHNLCGGKTLGTTKEEVFEYMGAMR